MGLFNNLFGKKNEIEPAETLAENQEHQEDWEFYFSNINDELGSIFFDIGINEIAPIKDKTKVVWISIKMNNPNEDGLSSQEESETLNEIEEAFIDKIPSTHNAIYVGRITSVGDRDLYFYYGDTTLYDKTISEVMVAYPKYQYDYGTKEDIEWSVYFDLLFPPPRQFQCIQNRKVIEQLGDNGDNLTKERIVDHWIYFTSEKDRETYLKKISNDGFTIVCKEFDKELDETPFTLQLQRVDKVDEESVNEYVINLWELANETNAIYDGWETSVERD